MVQVTVNDSEVQALLRQALSRARTLAPAFGVAAQRLRSDTMRNFQQGGWYPQAWRRSRRGGQTLVQTAMLRNSLHGESGSDFAKVGTDVLYAAVHQFGATIRPVRKSVLRFRIEGRWISKHEVTIPARPFLPVNAAGELHPGTMRFVADLFSRYVAEGRTA
jgi:phage gpG-like protein